MRLKNFQQRGFARAVAADDAHALALFDLKRDILERPEFLLVFARFTPCALNQRNGLRTASSMTWRKPSSFEASDGR